MAESAFRLMWKEEGIPRDASHEVLEEARSHILRLAELGFRPTLYRQLEYEIEIGIRFKDSPAGPQEIPDPPSGPPPVEPVGDVPPKPRNVPATCIFEGGCPEKGAARNQWLCTTHAGQMNLQQRQAALAAFKAREPRAAPSENAPGATP